MSLKYLDERIFEMPFLRNMIAGAVSYFTEIYTDSKKNLIFTNFFTSPESFLYTPLFYMHILRQKLLTVQKHYENGRHKKVHISYKNTGETIRMKKKHRETLKLQIEN